jgi:hypothetical protein
MKPQNFYEVKAEKEVVWGGESALEAFEFFRRTRNASLYVSVWDGEDELDYRLITEPIEITSIVLSAIASTLERR